MKKVDGDKTGTYDGFLYILCGDVGNTIIVTAMGDENDRFYSLNDCLKEIEYDYNSCNTVIVIIEDMTNGKVYRYNNYADSSWYEVGETEGYA